MLCTDINITETTHSCQFQYEFGNHKCVTAVKVSNFTGHYLRNRSNLDIGVLGVFGIVEHMEQPPEIWSVPPVTPCISCSRKGTEFLFNNLFINFSFIYFVIFVTSDYITLHPVPGVES